MKNIAIFHGVDAQDLERDVNGWVNENKIDVVDIKVNLTTLEKGDDWFTITVIHNASEAVTHEK